MSEHPQPTLFKILSADVRAAAEAQVPPMPIDVADGYVHLSTAGQLRETLALHFKGQANLIILAIRTAEIEPDLRWEPSRGGQHFPHVYGQIPMSAVQKEIKIDVAGDGTVELPLEFG